MSEIREVRSGNMLGDARAEADSLMLGQTFVETSDFRALRTTNDFNFVVGRRGTGKTALFLRLRAECSTDAAVFLHDLKPEEHDSLALVSVLRKTGAEGYDQVRPSARVLWRTSMLLEVARDLCRHWKYGKTAGADWLRQYLEGMKHLLPFNVLQRCTHLLREALGTAQSPEALPGEIAKRADISALEDHIQSGLAAVGSRAIFLFDGLDEGWGPDQVSTGALGGLAIAVAGFRDKGTRIEAQLFIRDNIFRSLAALDRDFSRHIEGNTLRLHWDEDSLLHLVASRLRVVLGMAGVENNVRVWNRFAHAELKDREGFQRCLQHTLYRPRDVLVLLNKAALRADRLGRAAIVTDDINATSKQISLDRLSDLLKEYDNVFPGLQLITASFTASPAFQTLGGVRAQLDRFITDQRYTSSSASDIAVLGTSTGMIDVLYSIGFLGLEDTINGAVRFCHDGAPSSIFDAASDRRIAIHPCYWRALDISEQEVSPDVLVEIYDDYSTRTNPQTADMRARLLGALVDELPACPEGQAGAREYEKWVLRTCQILFAGALANFELHPVPAGVQRRDVLATNQAERGFWRRVLDDYKCRQVVFEAKNHSSLGPDDWRQAEAYSGRQYGNLVFIVHRTDAEGLDNAARGWVKEMFDHKKVLLLTLPTGLLVRCLKKVRKPDRRDYAEDQLKRRLDTFERKYVALRQSPSKQRGRRKKRRQQLKVPSD